MRLLVTGLLILSLLGMGLVVGADAQEADAAPDSVVAADTDEDQGGFWLSRVLKNLFGRSGKKEEDLGGKSVELVSRYAAHIGKPIEVVIVHQVTRFDSYRDEDQGSGQTFLNAVTKPIHSYTKDRLIRDYLLFEQGEPVDPFLLADTERMLRELDFINDVRIRIVPLMGEAESVVVVIEIQDKWPFGVTGKIKDPNRYDVNLFFSNLGGYGVRLENKMIYRGDMEPNLGYQGTLRKRNIRGSFVDLGLVYQDSWEKLSRMAELQRPLIHPGIKWVGGTKWEYTDVRNNGEVPRKFELTDSWVGHTIPLRKVRSTEKSARPLLVPAVRFQKVDFKERPVAKPDSNAAYLNTRDYLVGLTFQRLKHYKTNLLFKLGETEDVPAGLTVKLTGGYQDREFYDRTSSFFQTAYLTTRNRGDILLGFVDVGGYFHDYVFEDGSLNVGATYITRLLGGSRYRFRFYSFLTYTSAFNRTGEGALVLGNKTGLRGLEDNEVVGNKRLILKLESRIFTPWRMMGFKFMVFGYADVGTVGGESDPLAQNKIYSSVGVGFQFENPELVLPATQIRIGFLNSIDENGLALGFKLGSVENPVIGMPGTKPGGFSIK
ncbi:MAG: hypothetical protein KAH56_08520 [Candidatus Krumholzibacteria bacterium]|nr:hypothetical protein [Candidatus Krumholzibacteria bacterium]